MLFFDICKENKNKGESLRMKGGYQIVVGNSDVWGMQCFCSVVSEMVSEHDDLFKK